MEIYLQVKFWITLWNEISTDIPVALFIDKSGYRFSRFMCGWYHEKKNEDSCLLVTVCCVRAEDSQWNVVLLIHRLSAAEFDAKQNKRNQIKHFYLETKEIESNAK